MIVEKIYLKNNNIIYDSSSIQNGLSTVVGRYNSTLSTIGPLRYFKAYQFDKAIDTDSKVNIQKQIKSGQIDDYVLLTLIAKSFILFNKQLNFNNIDVVITPESTAKLNNLIIAYIKRKYPHVTILKDGFVKRIGSKVELHLDKINQLDDKTKKTTLSNLTKSLSQDNWKMKSIFQRNKKFLSKIMDPTFKYNISGKNVLLIDDVLTEGTTLKDMYRICKELGAMQVFGYIFMTDK